MDDYLGEIRYFPYSFIPKGWIACNGQLMPIQQNAALYSLLGTQFGGDGKQNFRIPNLQGRVPLGLSQQTSMGTQGGSATVTLTVDNLPGHVHPVMASADDADIIQPRPNSTLGKASGTNQNIFNDVSPNNAMSGESLTSTGDSQPHSNMQPSLVLVACMCTVGIYPQRP